MRKAFEAYVKENNLFGKDDSVLLALSGGVDSVVLATLLLESGYRFSAAHCNFHLRGEESNRDEAFVRAWVEKNNVELFVADFDTYAYMQEKGVSLEMAARELRYSWFEQLQQENGFDFLATAHHADDSAETFFINLLRGTGIAGLHGILPKHNNIVRPLLFATRKDIMDYANQNNVKFVEDSTNSEVQFQRNKIRHKLFPLLKELSPNFDSVIRKNIERLRDTEVVFRDVVERVKKDIVEQQDDCIKISIAKLKEQIPVKIFAYEILSDYGFNEAMLNSVMLVLEAESGKRFFSKTHCLLKDRDYLFIAPIENETKEQQFLIEDGQSLLTAPFDIKIETLEDLDFISISKQSNIAMIDKSLLSFPLVLRHWKEGDYFVPFGMAKKKKLSDFFTSNKYNLIEKERQWLLCSGDDIVWVVGKRMDERFKVTSKTTSILKIEIK